MIRYTQGNLLEADVDALVNTVNTVGVMGKGIALMFKEAFPDNFKRYEESCKASELTTGKMFVTERQDLFGPKWIINFPTKQHWRNPTKLEWVQEGLGDLHDVITENNIHSIAIPPLGCGNGGLDWQLVKQLIETVLADLDAVDIVVFEPTTRYQNIAKKQGVTTLTPARALIAELIRRYSVLGLECSLLEVQKLAWFLERYIEKTATDNPLKLKFSANRYGPYTNRLDHLLNAMDGSYLHCEKRIADAEPLDVIRFDDEQKAVVQNYLSSEEAKPYQKALQATSTLIDGFESPLGMELLATVDWLIFKEGCAANLSAIKQGVSQWPAGHVAAQRKLKLFDDRLLGLALHRLESCPIN